MKKIRIRQQRLRDTLAQDQLEAFQRGMQACMAETEWAKSEGMPDMATMTRRDFNLVDQFEADCPAMTRRDMLDLIAIFRNRERGIVSKTESVEKVDAILARSGRAWEKRMKLLRANAEAGGRAVAHYKDATVEGAFRAFKERHASATAWEAANALIRAGQALCRWRHVNSAWNRIGRMADDLGLSRTAWFDAL
jgi:hypothetical protein